eukprot:7349920-Prymnesium_polylepis.1
MHAPGLDLKRSRTAMACSPVCGERFSHLTMNDHQGQGLQGTVCVHGLRAACLQRQLSGGGAMERVRKAARR